MAPEPATAPKTSPRIDAALAVVSAAIIAYGVLVLRWPVFIVMALFWFENFVIGGFNVLRMLVSGVRMGPAGLVGACAMSAFFTLHYGLFTAVHGTFVVMLFGIAELGREAMNGGLLPPVQRCSDAWLPTAMAGWRCSRSSWCRSSPSCAGGRDAGAADTAEGTDGSAVRPHDRPAYHADCLRLPRDVAQGAGTWRRPAGRLETCLRPGFAEARPAAAGNMPHR